MVLELNRATFRRLVQLYWVALLLSASLIGFEMTNESWGVFLEQFDVLVDQHFGPSGPSDAMLLPAIIGLGAIIGWMLASNIGLFWFRPWARFGTWASVIAGSAALTVVDGYRPTYSSTLLDIVTVVDCGLLGAVVLLAYAKDYGADWFGSAPVNKQEQ